MFGEYELWAIISHLRKPRRVFRLPTSDFQLPTSDFRLPTSVAMKGGGRPARYAKCCLFQIRFSFLLLGRLRSRRFWLSRLFHIERSWYTYRFTVVFVSGRQDFLSDARAHSLNFLLRPSKGSIFLRSAFWTSITM